MVSAVARVTTKNLTKPALGRQSVLVVKQNEPVAGWGFEAEGNQWHRPGITVQRGAEGGFLLRKELFVTEPLFYAVLPDGLGVATGWSLLVDILRQQEIGLLPDLDFVYDYLAFQCPFTSATLCRQVKVLRNGESVSINAAGGATSRLDPPLPATAAPPDPRGVKASLSAPLRDVGEAVFHLSSGLDSSLLVLLALASQPHNTLQVVTCQTRGRGATQELGIVRRFCTEFGLQMQVFDFTSIDLWDSGRNLIRQVLGYPIAHPSHLVRYLLDTAAAEKHRVIVTGRGADECLAGYDWHRAEFADPVRHIDRVRCTPDAVLRALLQTDTGGPPDGRAVRAYNEYMGCQHLTLASRLRYDFLTIFEAWNIIDHGLANRLGVRYVSPFLNRDLAATFTAMHDRFKIANQTQKLFLRQSFGDLYPHYMLDSPKVGLTIDLREYLRDESVDGIMQRLVGESPFGKTYVNRKACEALVRSTLDGRRNYGWQIWSLYLCSEAYERMRGRQSSVGN